MDPKNKSNTEFQIIPLPNGHTTTSQILNRRSLTGLSTLGVKNSVISRVRHYVAAELRTTSLSVSALTARLAFLTGRKPTGTWTNALTT